MCISYPIYSEFLHIRGSKNVLLLCILLIGIAWEVAVLSWTLNIEHFISYSSAWVGTHQSDGMTSGALQALQKSLLFCIDHELYALQFLKARRLCKLRNNLGSCTSIHLSCMPSQLMMAP